MLEMISTALLLLQLALHCYNVEGKHFLVKTKDSTKQDQTKDETSLEEHSPAGQVLYTSARSDLFYKSIRQGVNVKEEIIFYHILLTRAGLCCFWRLEKTLQQKETVEKCKVGGFF